MAQKPLHKNIKLIAWFNFFLSFRLYFPVLIIYFAQVSGSYALGMSVFSVTMIAAALLEIPTGVYSDTIGRKKTLVLGALATLLSTCLYAIGGVYGILVAGAVLEGLARSLYSGNNQALLHDTLAESGQQRAYAEFYGKTMSAEHVGLVITAVLGGIIAHWSFAWVMWLSVIPAFIGLVISFGIQEPIIEKHGEGNIYKHLSEAVNAFYKNVRLRKLSLSSIIGYGAAEAGFQFRPAFVATVWPLWAVGIAHALSNIGATLSYYYSGTLIKKFNALKVLMGGKIYAIISNTMALIYPSILSPAIMASNSLFHGSGSTSKSTLMQQEYTNEQRSTMESLNSLAGSIFFAVVSVTLGITADYLSEATSLLLLQILAVISLYILWTIFKENRFRVR